MILEAVRALPHETPERAPRHQADITPLRRSTAATTSGRRGYRIPPLAETPVAGTAADVLGDSVPSPRHYLSVHCAAAVPASTPGPRRWLDSTTTTSVPRADPDI